MTLTLIYYITFIGGYILLGKNDCDVSDGQLKISNTWEPCGIRNQN